MFKPEIRVFPCLEELSQAAAERFEEFANQSVTERKFFSAALSGGSTPKRLYEILASPSRRIPWEHVHLFQVDERCVPPIDPESNYKMIREALLARVAMPSANFHRMLAENPDRVAASREYVQEMAQVLKPGPGETPRLDLLLLGMGTDGHTASLFPDSPALAERALWVCPNFSERLGKHRLTMTYPVLNAAAHVIFQVTGEDKADTLRKVLEGPSDPMLLPAQGVRPGTGQLSWYIDVGAARELARV